MREQGIIEAVLTEELIIKINKVNSCKGCSLCGKTPGQLSVPLPEKYIFKQGQKVEIFIKPVRTMGNATTIFILPLILMAIFGFLFTVLWTTLGFSSSEASTITGCIIGLSLFICILPFLERFFGKKETVTVTPII
ncbi:MAG: SoxR reducing system RseC family protein [Candidatus Theseobacter exili]|nr:SoxR reducing system RseC family protein [Candidatus Theseobacter exili]